MMLLVYHMFTGLGNLPACKGGTNFVMGHLDMVPYAPDFLMDSQLIAVSIKAMEETNLGLLAK